MLHASKDQIRIYAVASLFVATAFFFTQWLHEATLGGNVFLLFFGAILATAWLGGFPPTVYVVVVAALLCDYFFLEPKGSFAIRLPGDGIRLLSFIIEGILIGLMSGILRASQNRTMEALAQARRNEHELVQVQMELEARVQRRTAELQKAKDALEDELGERQRTEAALRESEERFHAVFHNTFQFMGLTTPAGIVVEVNQSALDVARVTREAVVGQWLWDTPWWIQNEEARDQLKAWVVAAARGQFIREEVEIWGANQQTVTLDFSLKPLRNDEGIVTLLIPEGRDITEQKRAWNALQQSETRFYKFFYSSPAAMAITTLAEGRFLDANESMLRLYGYSRDELIGQTTVELGMWKNVAGRGTIVEQLQQYGYVHGAETQFRTKSGDYRDVIMSLEVLELDGTQVLLGAAYDLTERKQAEAALQESHQRVVQSMKVLEQRNGEMRLLNEMNDLLQAAREESEAYEIMVRYLAQLFPRGSGALYMLRASRNVAERVLGWGQFPPQMVFVEPNDCWALRRGRIHRTGNDEARPKCRHIMQDTFSAYETICAPLMAFGETLGVLQLNANPPASDAEGFVDHQEGLVAAVVDQIGLALANLKLRENLRFQAIRDALTGLYNRRFMQETLTHELQRARLSTKPLGVIMMDIDNFKRFNDTFGHQAGDMVLKAVGDYIQESGSELELACRYGGEEFALILPEMRQAEVVVRAEEICEQLKRIKLRHGSDLLGNITVSVGVAMYPQHGLDMETLFHFADRALYSAKQEGRDRVVVYH